MKTLILAILFAPFMAMACPDMQGEWSCDMGEDGKYVLKVEQQAIPNGMFYRTKINTSSVEGELYADGKTRPIDDEDYKGSIVAQCHGANKLTSKVYSEMKKNDYVIQYDLNVDLVNANTLKIHQVTLSDKKGGGDREEWTGSAVCTR